MDVKDLLESVKDGKIQVEEALDKLKDLPYTDLGYAKIDNHRQLRVGYPEIIYCSGKSNEQLKEIISFMMTKDVNIMGTRASEDAYLAVREVCPEAQCNSVAKIISIKKIDIEKCPGYIAVVTGGTSDIPVAEEAAITAEFFGSNVERLYDVGVAGIHRLLDSAPLLRGAKVLIVIAGMEGALTSVVGGLVDKPVIGVPTSVGYGANFGGLSALLTMLNSCSGGVSVVNIDNGFGAGYLANMINRL